MKSSKCQHGGWWESAILEFLDTNFVGQCPLKISSLILVDAILIHLEFQLSLLDGVTCYAVQRDSHSLNLFPLSPTLPMLPLKNILCLVPLQSKL